MAVIRQILFVIPQVARHYICCAGINAIFTGVGVGMVGTQANGIPFYLFRTD